MKENNRHRRTQDVECHSRVYLYILLLSLATWVGYAQTQSLPTGKYFTHGERVDYDLYFKWGILMPKAGLATLSVKESKFDGNPSWHYRLLFRTLGMMEKVFKMRDTIDCHFSVAEPQLLFSSKRTNEGDYYLIDDLRFSYNKNANTVSARSHRYNLKSTKIDTILTAQGHMFDMLGATMYLRSLDWENISYGDTFPFYIAIGRDLVNASYRYSGQQIVEHGGVKYRTRHFFIDIIDEAFTQNKEAAEVWIGDDRNHIPIKIRAKLKIGAAEVYYNASYNLRYPLDCRVVFSKN